MRNGIGEGEGEGDGGAEVGAGAGGGDAASVLAGDGADQEEAEAGAADARGVAARNAVEALEDAFELVGGKADASVGDGEGDVAVFDDGERAADFDGVGRVLDGVFEEIEDCGAEVLGDGADVEADVAGDGGELDGFGLEVVAQEGDGDAVGDEGGEFDEGAVLGAAGAEFAGLEDLLDGGEETVGVGQHDLVELLLLFLGDGVALEGFEVEADAGDGGLELVGDGVEEGVLALVAADFADQEDGVEDDSGGEQAEENEAKDYQGKAALVEDDPGDVEDDEADNYEHTEGDGKCDGSAASVDVHGVEMSISGVAGCELQVVG